MEFLQKKGGIWEEVNHRLALLFALRLWHFNSESRTKMYLSDLQKYYFSPASRKNILLTEMRKVYFQYGFGWEGICLDTYQTGTPENQQKGYVPVYDELERRQVRKPDSQPPTGAAPMDVSGRTPPREASVAETVAVEGMRPPRLPLLTGNIECVQKSQV
jgi:hypothetical protein